MQKALDDYLSLKDLIHISNIMIKTLCLHYNSNNRLKLDLITSTILISLGKLA